MEELTLNTLENLNSIENLIIPKYVGELKNLFFIKASLIPLEKAYYEYEDFSNLWERTYFRDGKVWETRETPSICFENKNSPFFGRKECKLKIGDKVCFVDPLLNNDVGSGVVFELPSSSSNGMELDSSDDSYVILEGVDEIPSNMSDAFYMDRHMHVSTLSVFPKEYVEKITENFEI